MPSPFPAPWRGWAADDRRLGIFASLATGAIGAVLIAVSASLTLTPAVVVLLGDRLDRFAIPVAVRAAQSGVFWRRLAGFVVRRRIAVVATIVPLMIALSMPLSGMHITLKSLTVLPRLDPVRAATETVAASFGLGVGAPAVVLARTSQARLVVLLRRQPGVAQSVQRCSCSQPCSVSRPITRSSCSPACASTIAPARPTPPA
ncbi:MAG: MMPL family transporter [Solirubrobacteraceae bacterium]